MKKLKHQILLRHFGFNTVKIRLIIKKSNQKRMITTENQQRKKPFRMRIGHATFRNQFNTVVAKFIKKQHLQSLQIDHWTIDWGQESCAIKSVVHLLLYMQENSCQIIQPFGINSQQKQKDEIFSLFFVIAPQIKFTNLRYIYPNYLDLCNIQGLSFLDCEIVQTINLQKSQVIQLKSLQKTRWNNLVEFNASFNPLHKMDLSRVKLAKNHSYVFFQSRFGKKNQFFTDISILAKFQCKNVKQLNDFHIISDKINSYKKNEANQIQVLYCLNEKYPRLLTKLYQQF